MTDKPIPATVALHSIDRMTRELLANYLDDIDACALSLDPDLPSNVIALRALERRRQRAAARLASFANPELPGVAR